MAWAAGAPTRLGFADARELGWIFCNRRVRAPSRKIHAADRNYIISKGRIVYEGDSGDLAAKPEIHQQHLGI